MSSSDNTNSYTSGDTVPAFQEDSSAPVSGAVSPIGHHDRAPPTAADIHSAAVDNLDRKPRSSSREGIIGRVSRSISRDPFFHRGSGQDQNAELRAEAQSEARHAAQSTEAGDIDRATSRSTSRSREFIRSVSRSLSRDPFFRRSTPEAQNGEIKSEAQGEADRARVAYQAGVADRERSKSKSRSRSRARDEPRGAAGFGGKSTVQE